MKRCIKINPNFFWSFFFLYSWCCMLLKWILVPLRCYAQICVPSSSWNFRSSAIGFLTFLYMVIYIELLSFLCFIYSPLERNNVNSLRPCPFVFFNDLNCKKGFLLWKMCDSLSSVKHEELRNKLPENDFFLYSSTNYKSEYKSHIKSFETKACCSAMLQTP